MNAAHERVRFSRQIAALLLWCSERGFRVALDEGRVINPRPVRMQPGVPLPGSIPSVMFDGVHRRGSLHYRGLAQDLVLYDDDWQPVKSSDDSRWREIAERWESQNPMCTSGIRWQDAGHCSWGEGTRGSSSEDTQAESEA